MCSATSFNQPRVFESPNRLMPEPPITANIPLVDGLASAASRLFKGIFLTPIGALVGTIIVIFGVKDDFVRGWILIGSPAFGPIMAAPVTCIVLPIARGPEKWGGRLMLTWLTGAGAISGFLEITFGVLDSVLSDEVKRTEGSVIEVIFNKRAVQLFLHDIRIVYIFVVAATVAGAVCGFLFAQWTQPLKIRSSSRFI